jgi:amino acid adenylation domain-containing protein
MKDLRERVSRLSVAERAHLERILAKEKARTIFHGDIPRSEGRESAPLSFAQERLWVLDQLEPGGSAYNMPLAVRMRGHLNVAALEQSLGEILRRHEALRTTFVIEEDRPVQRIAPPAAFRLASVDLSGMPEGQREAKAQWVLSEEASRPFDLAAGPLLRAVLIRLEQEEHILLVTMHHIVSDGWSRGILYRELSVLYEAFSKGNPSPLPELPIQYADFAVWQRQWLQGDVLAHQLSYWKKQLGGILPVQELPTDRMRPVIKTDRGASTSFQFPRELTGSLKALSLREGATLFMAVLAAFKALVCRLADQTDIIVGAPIAGRNRFETEGMIGFFVNTLVLRSDLSGNPTFRELLRRVHEICLDAYTHQDMPFEKLVEELNPERDLSRTPLFQVMFALQNMPEPNLELSGLTLSRMEIEVTKAKFDLEVQLRETGEGLKGIFLYNADLLDAATIERMAGHYRMILEGIVANPDLRLSELPLLTEAERQQLLVHWNDTKAEYPRDKCIHVLFEGQVERTPDVTAVVFEGRQLTYRELNAKANRLAHTLRKRGVGPEVLVGICMERSLEMVVGILGILKAGGAYVPLDPEYPKERLAFMVEDTKAPVLLTTQRLAELIPVNTVEMIFLDSAEGETAQEDRENPRSGATAMNLAYVMYTSGSTGVPKGVMVPHRAVTRLVCNTRYIDISPQDRIGQISSMSFDASTFEVWGSLLHGACLVGIPTHVVLAPETFAAQIREQKISVLFLTTALLNLMVREVPTAFRTLRHLLFGGEAVDASRVRSLLETGPPKRLLHVYGPTESATFATWYLVEHIPADAATVPIGKPISQTTMYVLDSGMQPVPVGVTGELFVGGDGLARGYLNHPELTAEKFIPNPFTDETGARMYKTGDLVRLRSDGNLEFVGRMDNQVKIRGFRVEPSEIESILKGHQDIRDVVIVSRRDVTGNNSLVAYVVPMHKEYSEEEGLRKFLKRKAPSFMVPSLFVIIDHIPLTPNGKIDYQSLPEPLQRKEEESCLSFAQSKLEQDLVRIWENLLHVRPIGRRDNFFNLGGHSLMIVQIFRHIEKEFGIKINPSVIFQASTIEQLAAVISDSQRAGTGASLVPIQPKGSRPPLFCVADVMSSVLLYRHLAKYLDPDQPVYGLESSEDVLHLSMEEIACQYVSELRRKRPGGPFLLLGFSSGGLIAFEMARQLRVMNLDVPFLGILDTACPGRSKGKHKLREAGWMRTFVRNVPYWLYYYLPFWVRHYGGIALNKLKWPSSDQTTDAYAETREHLERVTHWLKHYTPQKCPGLLTFYQAKAHGLFSSPSDGEWKTLVDCLNVQVVPGNHLSILKEPHVRVLAESINRELRKVGDHYDDNGRMRARNPVK